MEDRDQFGDFKFKSPGNSDDEDDGTFEDFNKCLVCSRQAPDSIHPSQIPENLLCLLINFYKHTIVSSDVICQQCIPKLHLICEIKALTNSDETNTDSRVRFRFHDDSCSYCDRPLQSEASDSNNNGPSYIEHRHLSNDGRFPSKHEFIKFALRCQHRQSKKHPTLESCLCQSCYRALLRKYEMSAQVFDSLWLDFFHF